MSNLIKLIHVLGNAVYKDNTCTCRLVHVQTINMLSFHHNKVNMNKRHSNNKFCKNITTQKPKNI